MGTPFRRTTSGYTLTAILLLHRTVVEARVGSVPSAGRQIDTRVTLSSKRARGHSPARRMAVVAREEVATAAAVTAAAAAVVVVQL